MEIGARCLYSPPPLSFSFFLSFFFFFLSLSLFRRLDTSPPFESISNDLEYYDETLPPLEQFHSCPFCHTLFFLFLIPSSLGAQKTSRAAVLRASRKIREMARRIPFQYQNRITYVCNDTNTL